MTTLIPKKYFINVDMKVEEEFLPRYINFLTDLLFSRCTHMFMSILTKYSVPAYEYRGHTITRNSTVPANKNSS